MRVRRVDAHDEIVRNEQVAVFVDLHVRVLSHMASALWSLIPPEGIEIDDLTAALVEKFGAPPGASAHQRVQELVEELRLVGLIFF